MMGISVAYRPYAFVTASGHVDLGLSRPSLRYWSFIMRKPHPANMFCPENVIWFLRLPHTYVQVHCGLDVIMEANLIRLFLRWVHIVCNTSRVQYELIAFQEHMRTIARANDKNREWLEKGDPIDSNDRKERRESQRNQFYLRIAHVI